jgi:DNA-binding IclR family transcriptional regulator
VTDTDFSAGHTRPRPRHRMVDLIATLLELAARQPDGMTLTEFARSASAPISSVQSVVNGLVSTGYLEERQRRYHLGTAPYLLSRLAGRSFVNQVSHRDLEALREEAALTALLSIAVGRDVFYIDNSASEARYRYLSDQLVRRSLIRTSSGWVLLAGMESRDLWGMLASFQAEDEERVERFLSKLDEIRETGICVAPNASEIADGIAAAVHHDGRTVAAVSIVGGADEIVSRRDELAGILARHRAIWAERRSDVT